MKQSTSKLILLILGLFLIIYSLSHFVLKYRSLALSRYQIEQLAKQHKAHHELEPIHITIPQFVDTPIETLGIYNNTWGISPTKATYLYQSARPSAKGNIIIYGHNAREILGNIRKLNGDEIITLTIRNGTKRMYQIQSLQEVSPTNTTFIQPTDTEVLTLYTCSGLFDSQRFIIRAIPTT